MTILPVIIDTVPTYLRGCGAPQSLLLLPACAGTLLESLARSIREVTDEALSIVTTWPADLAYVARVTRAGVDVGQVLPLSRFDEVLERLEPSDWLLLVDPRCCPVEAATLFSPVVELAGPRAARHLVAMRTSRQGTTEYVQFDEQKRVRRIQRLYDGVTWLQTRAVTASLVPASAAREVPSDAFRDLPKLREALVSAGVVSRDVDLPHGACDLRHERGLLQFCELSLRGLLDGPPSPAYRALAPGVWVGSCCCIDPAARLYGPVLLHDNIQVDADATLIGPIIIGSGSRVGRGTVLAECLVASGTVVPIRVAARNRVLCGDVAAVQRLAVEPSAVSFEEHASARLRASPPGAKEAFQDRHWRREACLAAKRVLEGVLALLGLIVLSPLLLLTAAAIKLTSRGPVFFHHEREGKGGRPFRCCKFRTMVWDAHRQQRALYRENALDGPQFKLRHDPRITWVGRWVRTTNLDELPQLFNVVLGQMSLIGPRPSPFRENQICVPWREARLAVRPGITGLWQICRHERSAGDFHQWIHFDMLYVRHLSLWLDLKILLATLLTLGGRWSVPVIWLIPARKLRAEEERAAPARPVSLVLASALLS